MNYLILPKKSLGQNFLNDQNIINKIVNIGNIKNYNIVMEIGPGYGSLTKKILNNKPKKLYAIEKDKKLSNHLKNIFKNSDNINIINDDFLEFIKQENVGKKIIVFGNLPYNVSTQILASLATLKKWPPWFEILIFMFQKEVADRIIANDSSKDYSRLTVLSNWRFEIKKHFDISKNCFSPKPKVSSTLLSFKPVINKYKLKNPKTLEKITSVLFSNRRKMINKNFLKLFGKNEYLAKELNLNLSHRPEQLSKEMFYKIAMKYEELVG